MHVMSPFDMTFAETKELWARITAPILLVSGSESWARHASDGDPSKGFSNARHVTIDDAGHWVHHDQLDRFLALTREFLAQD